jgi:hypothetical protein
MTINFESIKVAVISVQSSPDIKRIDGPGWSVYKVGSIIRVDIKEKVCSPTYTNFTGS